MRTGILSSLWLGLVLLPGMAESAPVQSHEDAVVESASQVLNEIMAIPFRAIPQSLLKDSQGVAIVPGMIKGGFVVGVRHGRGVIVARDVSGQWQAPVFISITGGSVGWQAGVQATDVVLVFRTKNSLDKLMRGKFTIGADAAAAAGPIGRQASAATDMSLKAEILSYSRSRGLFAGVALDGSALQIDTAANNAYYQGRGALPGQISPMPASAVKLLQEIARHSGTLGPAPIPAPLAPGASRVDTMALQRQLADASRSLQGMLDDNWKNYLALPVDVYGTDRAASAEALARCLERFNAVAANPQYQALAQRPEFQQTIGLMRQYIAAQSPAGAPPLALPPPPR